MKRLFCFAAALACAPSALAQSVFDLLARIDLTERWMVIPGKDSCEITYSPADGSPVINGQPSLTVKHGSAALSFSNRWTGGADLSPGVYRLTAGAVDLRVEGMPWDDRQSGLRLMVPANFAETLARGSEVVVKRGDQTVLAFQFEADMEMLDQMRACMGNLPR